MFDLFNRKRIERLTAEVAALKTALREQDQLIYNMSQCTGWPAMQRHFGPLLANTEARRRAESDRISENIIRELNAI